MAGLVKLNPLARKLLQPTSRLLATHAGHSLSYGQALSNTAETKVTVLNNGLRVATEDSNAETATVGVYIDAGSRHENAANNGAARFLQHALLKGTTKRAQASLEAEIEGLGGELSSVSTRERTAFFAKVAKKDVSKAVEILGDILQNPSLTAENIEATRKVILEEIEQVGENIAESVFDHLHSTAFQGGNLSQTPYGSVQNVKSFTQEQLKSFLKDNYTAPRIVLAAAGGVNHAELVKAAEQNFGGLSSAAPTASKAPRFVGSEIKIRDDEKEDAHIAFAVEGPSANSPDLFPILVTQHILGSWDRSLGGANNLASRLAQSIAKYNLCSGYKTFTNTYSDTGLFGFYVVTEHRERMVDLMFQLQNDWVRICVNANAAEVETAKNQLRASLLLKNDGTTSTFHDIGSQVLSYGRRLSAYEIDSRINDVSASTVRSTAYKYLYDKDPAIVAFGPIEGFPDYNRIQTATHWLRV